MYMLRNVCVYVYVYIFIYISANVIRDTVKRENIPDIKRIMQIIILYQNLYKKEQETYLGSFQNLKRNFIVGNFIY